MADFQTVDLGRILQTAESIKGMRQNTENDKLRNAYLGQQQQRQDQQDEQAQAAAQQKAASDAQNMDWKRVASAAASVAASNTPKDFAEQNFPQFIQEWDSTHGAGSWATLDDNKVRQLAQGYVAHAQSQLGEMPQAQKVDSEPLESVIGPDGKPVLMRRSEAAGKTPYERPRSGISITGPDGTTMQLGGDGTPTYGDVGLQKATRTKLEEAFTNSQGNAFALREQLSKYRDEFSTVSGKLKAGIANAKEQIGMENAPQQTQYLSDFTSWKADTASLLSQYLNQLSGAAISPAEETRLKSGFPNADDGPTQYRAKAQETMRRFALVQARSAYLLSNPNLNLNSVSLDSMSGVISREANRLAESLKRGGMNAEEAQKTAIAKTRDRFGMN